MKTCDFVKSNRITRGYIFIWNMRTLFSAYNISLELRQHRLNNCGLIVKQKKADPKDHKD